MAELECAGCVPDPNAPSSASTTYETGSQVLSVQRASLTIRTTAGVGRAEARMIDLNNPLAEGTVTVLEYMLQSM